MRHSIPGRHPWLSSEAAAGRAVQDLKNNSPLLVLHGSHTSSDARLRPLKPTGVAGSRALLSASGQTRIDMVESWAPICQDLPPHPCWPPAAYAQSLPDRDQHMKVNSLLSTPD